MAKLTCFDCETDLIPKGFNKATGDDWLHLAPKLRLCCTFDGETWRDFWPGQAKELIAHLKAAHTLLSFNGLGFDEIVLRRHASLEGKLPRSGRHFDLCQELYSRGTPASLDDLARGNLNEGKLVKGHQMSGVEGPALVAACRSDVWQTWRLWEMWERGGLMVPARRARQADLDDSSEAGPGHHAPEMPVCPHCGDTNGVQPTDDMDVSEICEAEAIDYEYGVWGIQRCTTCGSELKYGF